MTLVMIIGQDEPPPPGCEAYWPYVQVEELPDEGVARLRAYGMTVVPLASSLFIAPPQRRPVV